MMLLNLNDSRGPLLPGFDDIIDCIYRSYIDNTQCHKSGSIKEYLCHRTQCAL